MIESKCVTVDRLSFSQTICCRSIPHIGGKHHDLFDLDLEPPVALFVAVFVCGDKLMSITSMLVSFLPFHLYAQRWRVTAAQAFIYNRKTLVGLSSAFPQRGVFLAL